MIDHPLLTGHDTSYRRFWILPNLRFDQENNQFILTSARIFECLKDDGVFVTVQERTVENINGELWVGSDVIGRPVRKKIRHWDASGIPGGGPAYFLPRPSKPIEYAQQWDGRALIVGQEWGIE